MDGERIQQNTPAFFELEQQSTDIGGRLNSFLEKTFNMLEENKFEDIISWTPQGDTFIIKNNEKFEKSVLPQVFRHSKLASFIRQLHMYSFQKKHSDADCQVYQNAFFKKGRKDLLHKLRRRISGKGKKQESKGEESPFQSEPENLEPKIKKIAKKEESYQEAVLLNGLRAQNNQIREEMSLIKSQLSEMKDQIPIIQRNNLDLVMRLKYHELKVISLRKELDVHTQYLYPHSRSLGSLNNLPQIGQDLTGSENIAPLERSQIDSGNIPRNSNDLGVETSLNINRNPHFLTIMNALKKDEEFYHAYNKENYSSTKQPWSDFHEGNNY